MESEKKYNVRVEVGFVVEVPVCAIHEDEAAAIADSMVQEMLPDGLVDNYGCRAIEVEECSEPNQLVGEIDLNSGD